MKGCAFISTAWAVISTDVPKRATGTADIREGLRNRGYEVVEIQFGQLTDPTQCGSTSSALAAFCWAKMRRSAFATIPPGMPLRKLSPQGFDT